jgi:3-hydroxybutyryl-CoA dehydrogenase
MKNDLAEKPKEDTTSMTNVSFGDIVLNFGFGTKLEKKSFLAQNTEKIVYMDLTCFDPNEFYTEFPNLKGTFASLFADEDKKIEIHYKEKNPFVLEKFRELGFNLIETSIISCGFIFPRTIAQIINEAYFALEEGVASKEDINRAMKFGVNYPKGPFEWAAGKERYVHCLLEELYNKTGNKRYRPSPLLET